VQARVRQGETGLVHAQVGVHEEVEVDDARAPAHYGLCLAEPALERLQRREKVMRGERRHEARCGVHELRLVLGTEGKAAPQAGASDEPRIGEGLKRLECPFDLPAGIAPVAATRHVGGTPGHPQFSSRRVAVRDAGRRAGDDGAAGPCRVPARRFRSRRAHAADRA
jgi:hypothetical protein